MIKPAKLTRKLARHLIKTRASALVGPYGRPTDVGAIMANMKEADSIRFIIQQAIVVDPRAGDSSGKWYHIEILEEG